MEIRRIQDLIFFTVAVKVMLMIFMNFRYNTKACCLMSFACLEKNFKQLYRDIVYIPYNSSVKSVQFTIF